MAHIHAQPQYVIAQPQVVAHMDLFRSNHNDWTVELCNCCDDMGQCCYAYFCWHCFVASLAGKIDESAWSCCCVPNALGVYRMKVRMAYKIRGDACNDYCVVCCCPFCAALQMRNELRNHGLP